MKFTKLANGSYQVTMRGKTRTFLTIEAARQYAWSLQMKFHANEAQFNKEWDRAMHEMAVNKHPIADFGFFGTFMFTQGMDDMFPNHYNGGYKQ